MHACMHLPPLPPPTCPCLCCWQVVPADALEFLKPAEAAFLAEKLKAVDGGYEYAEYSKTIYVAP